MIYATDDVTFVVYTEFICVLVHFVHLSAHLDSSVSLRQVGIAPYIDLHVTCNSNGYTDLHLKGACICVMRIYTYICKYIHPHDVLLAEELSHAMSLLCFCSVLLLVMVQVLTH